MLYTVRLSSMYDKFWQYDTNTSLLRSRTNMVESRGVSSATMTSFDLDQETCQMAVSFRFRNKRISEDCDLTHHFLFLFSWQEVTRNVSSALPRYCLNYLLHGVMLLVETIKTKKFVTIRTEGFIFFAVALLASLDCCCLIFS